MSRIGMRRKVRNSRAVKARVVEESASIKESASAVQESASMSSDSDWMSSLEIPCEWTNKSVDERELRLCYVSYQEAPGCQPLVVTRSLIVKPDYTWMLHVNGHLVDPLLIPSLAGIPSSLSSETASVLLQTISRLSTCPGNPDSRFVVLGEKKKNGQFLSQSKEVVAYLDSGICVSDEGKVYPSTIRCSKCHLLIEDARCTECRKYRKNLITQALRTEKTKSTIRPKSYHKNYRLIITNFILYAI